MEGELRIRVADERTPPPIAGLDADDGQWRLSLAVHRDLLVDVTGIEPTGELTDRELATIRARLEGYVEREIRGADAHCRRTPRGDRTGGSSDHPFQRLLVRLRDVLPVVGATGADRDSRERETDAQRSWSVERVRQLARIFRAAANARRPDISSADATRSTTTTDATPTDVSSSEAAAD